MTFLIVQFVSDDAVPVLFFSLCFFFEEEERECVGKGGEEGRECLFFFGEGMWMEEGGILGEALGEVCLTIFGRMFFFWEAEVVSCVGFFHGFWCNTVKEVGLWIWGLG